MFKTRLMLKPALVLSAAFVLGSCVSETESPIIQEIATQASEMNNSSGDENLRKAAERNYFEKFDNTLSPRPGEGFSGGPDQAFYPGTGKGNTTHMGKAVTFLNQFAQFGETGLETVAAPVTMFFKDDLDALGLMNIPDNVSSITTDGKGNSVWFKTIKNSVSMKPDGSRADFQAEVEIIGGTGKFLNAKGTGEVVGFFNPANGVGSSTMKGRIEY